MALDRFRRLAVRISVIDVVTLAVLAIAILLLVRPGSVVYSAVNGWLSQRELRTAVRDNWDELSRLASPLYPGTADPEVIEFIDYQCPFCRASSSSVDSAIAAGVRVAIIHLPLPIHPAAGAAAQAALCADRVGRLPEVHRALITGTDWYDDQVWLNHREFSEISALPAFIDCTVAGQLDVVVGPHLDLATRIGVRQTPVFVASGRILKGPPSRESLTRLARK